MSWTFDELLTVTFTLFAVIDIVGSVPALITLSDRLGGISEAKATGMSGALMILFVFVGEKLLSIFGVDVSSFAVGGSIVIFIIGLEMVLGVEFFKTEADPKSGSLVPVAFPMIAGSGTLTTIVSLRANYDKVPLVIAILINLIFIYLVLRSLKYIARLLGKGGLTAVRKFFGVVLLAIAVKIFSSNVGGLLK
jgi:multiple antibiotic resistance protein